MKNFPKSKRWKLIVSCIVLIALVLLAMSLRDVRFKPSQSINFSNQQETNSRLPHALPGDQVIIVIAILILLTLVLLLVPRETRKWVLIIFSSLALFIFILYLISNASRAKVIFNQLPGVKNPIAPPTPAYNDLTPQIFQPPAEFHPPQVSNLIIYLVSLTIILLLIFLAWIIYRRWHSRPPQKIFNSLEGLGEAARLALDDLAAGLDGQDAIIICYTRMSEVVMQKRDMERGKSRTASEFATRLISAGLPGDSVRRLTRLFESARYGMRESQPVEIEEAKACLTEIARYCGAEV